MANVKIDVEVSGVERTIRRIKQDLHNGMEDSVDTLVDQARRHARGVISEERAIFNTEVYKGFKDAETKNTPSQVRAKLYNDVEHAEVLEDGAAFPAQGPPVAALLPWVARKMQWGSSFDPGIYGGKDYYDGGSHGDDGDDGGSDDGGGGHDDPPDFDPNDRPENDSSNWTRIPSDYDDILEIDESSYVETTYGAGQITKVDSSNGIYYKWNGQEYTVRPSAGEYEHFRIEADGSAEYIDTTSKAEYFDLQTSNEILGQRRGTSVDSYTLDFYRKTDLPPDYHTDYEESYYRDYKNWAVGDRVVLRGSDGIVHQVEVTENPDNGTINGYDLDSEFSINFTPEDAVGDDSEYKIVGVENNFSTQDLEDAGFADYTADFDQSLYGFGGDGLREYSEYVATSNLFDGAKKLKRNRHGELVDGDNNDYGPNDVKIQGISKGEAAYNKLDTDDEILVHEFEDGSEFVETGNTFSVRIKKYETEPYENDFVMGRRVFDDDVERLDQDVQIYPESIIGSREDNEDLWGDEATIREPVNVNELDDDFRQFTTEDEEKVFRTIDENGHAILNDGTDSYKVVRHEGSGNAYNLRTKNPDSEGEHLEFAIGDSSIDITHVSKKVYQYEHFEQRDYLVVDPEEYWQDGAWTQRKFRATVDRVRDTDLQHKVRVKPFGSPSNHNEELRYEAFVEARSDSSGWNANDIEQGNLVTFERNGERITGRVTKTRNEDLKQYEEGQIQVDHGEIGTTAVNEFEVKSFEDDGFTERYEDAPLIVDYGNSDFSEYNSDDKLSMLRPEEFDPLDGRGDLQEGARVGTELDSDIGEISSVFDDGRYQIYYYNDEGERVRTVVVDQSEIDYYEGMETDPLLVSSGKTISTGDYFAEVTEKVTDDNGNPIGAKLTNGDILDFDQFVPVTEELPKGKEVEFWDHRAGEKRFGEISNSRFDGVDIRAEDDDDYTNYSSRPDSLHPVSVLGYRDESNNDSLDLSDDAKDALKADEVVDLTDAFGSDDLYLRDREQLFKNLRSMYPSSATGLYSDIESWKSGGSKDLTRASDYSKKLAVGLRIDADIRGDSRIRVSDEDAELTRTLHKLSVGFLKEHYDSEGDGEVRAHRTLREEAPRLSKQIWENPEQKSWEIPTNAVNNYTTTASNLEGFDRSLLHSKEFDIEDDVLIAVDALIHSDWEREGEIHIRGDFNFNFDGKDLEFQSSSYSDSVDFLTDQFFEDGNFGPFTDDQVLAIGSTVREMGQNRVSLNSDGADRIHGFIDELDERDLYGSTNFSEKQWKTWESVISGDGKSLTIDGQEKNFPVGWETYDPLTVDTVPLEDTYQTQSVDILDINTEEIISATIINRDSSDPIYDLETEYGDEIQIWQAGMDSYDDYKIIAGENWEELDEPLKDNLLEDRIRNADYLDFDVAAREEGLKDHLVRSSNLRRDKKEVHDMFHDTSVSWMSGGSNGNTLGSHRQLSSTGKHEYKFSDSAQFETVMHEVTHGGIDENEFFTDVYPDGDDDDPNKFFRNLFDEDGKNKFPDLDRDLEQVLLKKDESPPGLNPDGSLPQIVKDRVEVPEQNQYDFGDVSDVPEFLHPEEGDFQIGDRVEFKTTVLDRQKAQLVGIGELDTPAYDTKVTKYEISPLQTGQDNTIELWVDEDGNFFNMKGVEVYRHANQPEETTEATFPEVDLKESGYEKLAEASNIAFMEIMWSGVTTRDDTETMRGDNIPFTSDVYSVKDASETLTTTSEMLTMDYDNPDRSYMTRDNLEFLIDRYPYLVEAWLEQYRPSPKAAKVLRDKGYDV